MRYVMRVFALTVWLTVATASAHGAEGIEKIAAYAGTWKIVIDHVGTPYSKAGHEESTLRNDCWRSGGYFACNQYVNGESKALLVFTYDAKTDRYTSYPVPPDGGDAGKGVLEIRGNTWTYPWEVKDGETKEGDKTTYFRVVNVFSAPDTIEFRQEFSADKVTWTPMAHGHETRIAAGIVK